MSAAAGARVVARLDRAGPVEAEVLARAAWSLVAEPGDATAVAVVTALGAPEALRWAAGAVGAPPHVAEGALRARVRAGGTGADAAGVGPSGVALRVLARVLPRWAPRLAVLDPEPALDALRALGGALVVPGGPGWPVVLDDLGGAAPLCLWVRGAAPLDALARRSVAVVGARSATSYGQHVASDLAGGLASAGVTVVSGGAFGIDVAAHRGALGVGGPTVALLAGGVDRPSPEANRPVLDALVDGGGGLVAESPPGTTPSRSRFLLRNRLIAALSGTTVVVEAAWRSGALSTAAHAADLLRPVGAVPGPITSMASTGCHRLLRDGLAVCVTGRDDVLELLDGVRAGGPGAGTSDGDRDADRDRTAPGTDAAGGVAPGTDAAGGAAPGTDAAGGAAPGTDAAGGAAPGSRPPQGARGGVLPGGREARHERPYPSGSTEARVVDALPARRVATVPDLARRAGLAEREVAGALGVLELGGSVRRSGPGWARVRS